MLRRSWECRWDDGRTGRKERLRGGMPSWAGQSAEERRQVLTQDETQSVELLGIELPFCRLTHLLMFRMIGIRDRCQELLVAP